MDIHRESSETTSPSNRRQDSHRPETALTSDLRSNEQTQIQQSIEQGFASMATGLTAVIKDAFKSFADKFECGVNEEELLSEGDDEEFESSHGEMKRQNDNQVRKSLTTQEALMCNA